MIITSNMPTNGLRNSAEHPISPLLSKQAFVIEQAFITFVFVMSIRFDSKVLPSGHMNDTFFSERLYTFK